MVYYCTLKVRGKEKKRGKHTKTKFSLSFYPHQEGGNGQGGRGKKGVQVFFFLRKKERGGKRGQGEFFWKLILLGNNLQKGKEGEEGIRWS